MQWSKWWALVENSRLRTNPLPSRLPVSPGPSPCPARRGPCRAHGRFPSGPSGHGRSQSETLGSSAVLPVDLTAESSSVTTLLTPAARISSTGEPTQDTASFSCSSCLVFAVILLFFASHSSSVPFWFHSVVWWLFWPGCTKEGEVLCQDCSFELAPKWCYRNLQ